MGFARCRQRIVSSAVVRSIRLCLIKYLFDRKRAAKSKFLYLIPPRHSFSQMTSSPVYNYSCASGGVVKSDYDRKHATEKNEGALDCYLADHHDGYKPFTEPCEPHKYISATNASVQHRSGVEHRDGYTAVIGSQHHHSLGYHPLGV